MTPQARKKAAQKRHRQSGRAGKSPWAGTVRGGKRYEYRKPLPAAVATKRGYWFDEAAADHVCDFFERVLVHTKGRWAGKPFALLGWQRACLRELFGWKREDGTRVFRRASIWIPKKNGKSTLLAGIVLYLLIADGEPAAEVYTAAVDREQAAIIYRECREMVRRQPALAKKLRCIDSTKRILSHRGDMMHSMSHEAPTKEGLNASAVVIDELHAHPKRELFDTLFYSGAARTQPLFISISTAGVFDPEAVGWKEYQYAKRVAAKPEIDPEYFAFVAEADPEEDDWTKPATWRKANPSLGETITESDMAAEVRRALEQPDLVNAFKRYRLNIWTQSETAWLPVDKWDRCRFDPGPLDGREHHGGLDLSTTTDLTAWVRVWPLGDGRYACRGHYYLPEEGLARRIRRDRVPYDRWAKDGWLTLTPGNVVDYAHLRDAVLEDAGAGGLIDVGFDPWNGMQLATELMAEGIEMIEVRQGYRTMSEPMKKLMALVLDGKLDHGGDPVMAWAANNVVARQDPNGNIAPAKDKSTGRIDPIVALIIALVRAIGREQDSNTITFITM